jgi:hypothetical protein
LHLLNLWLHQAEITPSHSAEKICCNVFVPCDRQGEVAK